MLGCVESLYIEDDPQIAASAQYAWDRLSEASHHHAYELAPTHVEVEGLETFMAEQRKPRRHKNHRRRAGNLEDPFKPHPATSR